MAAETGAGFGLGRPREVALPTTYPRANRHANPPTARKSFPTNLDGFRFSALTAADAYQMACGLGIKDFGWPRAYPKAGRRVRVEPTVFPTAEVWTEAPAPTNSPGDVRTVADGSLAPGSWLAGREGKSGPSHGFLDRFLWQLFQNSRPPCIPKTCQPLAALRNRTARCSLS